MESVYNNPHAEIIVSRYIFLLPLFWLWCVPPFSMWELGGTQSASPGGVQFGSRSNFAPTEPCVPCNLAFVSSGHPLFLRNCVNDHLWYPLLGYFFRGNALVETETDLLRWLYKLLFLLNGLAQKGHKTFSPRCWVLLWLSRSHLDKKVLAQNYWRHYQNTNITRELWMLSWDQSFKNTLRATWISIESLCSC